MERVGRQIASGLGLSVRALQDGITRHGGIMVALAALAAAELPAWRIRTSRAAVLAGMLRKPPVELNPLGTLDGESTRRCGRRLKDIQGENPPSRDS